MNITRTLALCAGGCAILLGAARASAHGFIGGRFFPPTVATDDPFAVDEFALPTVSWLRNPADGGNPAFHEIDSGFEFDKEILPAICDRDFRYLHLPASRSRAGYARVG